MKSNLQGNSLSAVIIAILFVSLMATLGVVFYQNFVSKPTVTVQKPTSTPLADTTATARIAFNNTIYDLDYPKTWSVTRTSDQNSSAVAITNADGTVRANLSVSKNTIDTTCNSGDGLQIDYYNVNSAPDKNLIDVPVFLVESIFDSQGGGYQYKIGLVPDGGDTNTATGTTHCTVAQVGIVSMLLLNGQVIAHPTVLATINFPKLPAAPKTAAADIQTLKDLMGTGDYKSALAILLSARKE